MRFIACGGRDYHDEEIARQVLRNILATGDTGDILVHGAATGADSLAAQIWWELGGQTEAHPAQWDIHGKAAGPIRNQEMLDTGVDFVVAFPGGRGTAHMVSIAKKAGLPVLHIGNVDD